MKNKPNWGWPSGKRIAAAFSGCLETVGRLVGVAG
jgi:hypothetical protein